MRLVWMLFPFVLCAQTPEPKLAVGKPSAKQGRALFLSNCSICHGALGEGGRGPNLSSGMHQRGTAELEKVIRQGVPGSQMPSFAHFEGDEMGELVAFVKNLGTSGAVEKAAGDASAGKAVYESQRCAMCHRIGREGSVYGPDLSRVGAGRSLAYLRSSIIDPSADVMPESQGVLVTTQDGTRVQGVRVNEDTFTVQLRDIGQRFRMFSKDEVKSVESMKKSLMPAYPGLAPKELDDLVAYLSTLRGPASDASAKQAEGIR
jgi:putative heme-binding domain-containing protein